MDTGVKVSTWFHVTSPTLEVHICGIFYTSSQGPWWDWAAVALSSVMHLQLSFFVCFLVSSPHPSTPSLLLSSCFFSSNLPVFNYSSQVLVDLYCRAVLVIFIVIIIITITIIVVNMIIWCLSPCFPYCHRKILIH